MDVIYIVYPVSEEESVTLFGPCGASTPVVKNVYRQHHLMSTPSNTVISLLFNHRHVYSVCS